MIILVILEAGHALFVGVCKEWVRGICVALRQGWVDARACFIFKSGRRTAYADMDARGVNAWLLITHFPHAGHPEKEYEDLLEEIGRAVEEGTRKNYQNLIGVDAYAVIGKKTPVDDPSIITGESTGPQVR